MTCKVRHLIPASPWYATAAAGCGIAAIGLYILRLVSQLATRAYSSMLLAVMFLFTAVPISMAEDGDMGRPPVYCCHGVPRTGGPP